MNFQARGASTEDWAERVLETEEIIDTFFLFHSSTPHFN